ncbi:MAG TPA: hypothetical protein VMV92_41375 [Streptosporangiaceae bacterium]|nr:hypothetical protein [Streptosporangiaceae bacterium]
MPNWAGLIVLAWARSWRLAVRAAVGCAARDLRAGDQGAAHVAGLALAPEYLRMVEVTCPAAEVVDVGGDAGAAGLDRAAEDGPDRRVQAVGLGQGEGAGRAGGVDAGVMQGPRRSVSTSGSSGTGQEPS